MSMRPRPFVLPAKRPSDARPAATRAIGRTTAREIGPDDIVIVNGDSVQVCRMDTPQRSLADGPAPLSLCLATAGGEAPGQVAGLNVTHVGGVLMLRVE